MKDFLVTVDGKYLYVGHIEFIKNVIDSFTILPVIDQLEEYLESIGLSLESEFNHTDYAYTFDEDTGRVSSISSYFSVYNSKTKTFSGYSKVADFWKKAKQKPNGGGFSSTSANSRDLTYYRNFNTITPIVPKMDVVAPEAGDRILFVKREILDGNSGYYIKVTQRYFIFPNSSHSLYPIIKKKLDYKVVDNQDVSEHILDNNDFFQSLNAPDAQIINLEIINPKIKLYAASIKEKKFKRADGSRGITEFEIDIVESVAFIFNALFNNLGFVEDIAPENQNLLFVFDKHFDIINDINYNLITQDEYDIYFNLEYFQRLRIRLLEFYHVMAKGRWYINSEVRTHLASWIYGLFTSITLKHILYDKKVELLKDIVSKEFFISGRWNPLWSNNKLTEEELIVKIIQSIERKDQNGNYNLNEINLFIDLLNDYSSWTSNSKVTLFQTLYDSIDFDVLFDDGKGAKGQFVKTIYSLWQKSKYNPRSGQTNLVPYEYTNYHAMWNYENTQEFDKGAATYILPYKSERRAVFFADNFNFEFNENKIIANWLYKNSNDRVTFGVIVDMFPALFERPLAYSYYDIFQPIGVMHLGDVDTAMSLPIDPQDLINVSNPCDLTEVNNIPIFYMKYIDELGDRKDGEEAIFLTIDIVSTLLGGWGIARRLLFSSGKIAIRTLFTTTAPTIAPAVRTSLMRTLGNLAIPTLEFILGIANIAHNISENNCGAYNDCNNQPPQPGAPDYEDYQRCQAIQKWLLALEVLTLSGDLLAKRFFRKSTRELNEKLPSTNPYNDIDDVDYGDFRNKINGLDDILAEYNDFVDFLNTNGYESIATWLGGVVDENKRFAFMFGFTNRADALDKLILNPNLLDDWLEVVDDLAQFRNNIDYLKSYRRFTDNPYEVFHITDFTNGSSTGFRPIGAHGGKNLTNGVVRDPNLPAPPNKPPTTVFESKNNHVTYENTYFIRPDGSLKKKKYQTIWNPAWSDDRIKGEMALAFSNKKLIKPPTTTGINIPGYSPPPQYISTFKSRLSDGTEVEFRMMNFGQDPVTNSIKEDFINYFKLILN